MIAVFITSFIQIRRPDRIDMYRLKFGRVEHASRPRIAKCPGEKEIIDTTGETVPSSGRIEVAS